MVIAYALTPRDMATSISGDTITDGPFVDSKEVAARVTRVGPGRIRVAVDGRTGAGKTSFGHELAAALRARGRPTMRASLDDFKNRGARRASAAMTGPAARGITATLMTSARRGTCCSAPPARPPRAAPAR
jgi:hypothetical protein